MNRVENVELMKGLTVGVEIETSGLSRPHSARIIRDYYANKTGLALPPVGHENSYDASVVYDGIHAQSWKCMSDCSVIEHNEGMAEVVTPILKYEDIEDVQQIVRLLRQAGAKSSQHYHCGVHIHIGADIGQPGGQTAKSLRNLSNIMASHEQLLYKAVNVSYERTRHFTQFSDPSYIRDLNTIKPQSLRNLEQIWYHSQGSAVDHSHYNDTRYHMLNLHATWTKGTCEFRLFEFHENMHAGELKAYIQLCLAMCSYAKLVSFASYAPVDMRNEKRAMKTWLDNLGLRGDEFKTCRKMLMKRLSGECAYAHGRPVVDTLDDLALAD